MIKPLRQYDSQLENQFLENRLRIYFQEYLFSPCRFNIGAQLGFQIRDQLKLKTYYHFYE